MIWIVENVGERISKHRQRFFDGDPMFLEVLLCPFRIPLKFRSPGTRLTTVADRANLARVN